MARLHTRNTLFPYTTLFRSELLRNGKSPPADPALIQQGWAAAARSQIAQEQTAVTAEVACEIFGAVPEFWQAQRLLRSEEHTSELQSRENLVCRLLLEKKNN